jgi:integrase
VAAAGRGRSKSFVTRRLADSYRAELVRAARQGLKFDPETGEPALWAVPVRPATTWHTHAVAYAAMKWPELAAHSRASLADALATVTPALTRDAPRRPPPAVLRSALYACAFNPARTPDPAAETALAWAEQASLPVARLADPAVLRTALDALTSAWTVTGPRRTPSPASAPCCTARWATPSRPGCWTPTPPTGSRGGRRKPPAVNPRVVASPAQIAALLAAVAQIRPELTAFFGCLYYAALRPEEAVALRAGDCNMPATCGCRKHASPGQMLCR